MILCNYVMELKKASTISVHSVFCRERFIVYATLRHLDKLGAGRLTH